MSLRIRCINNHRELIALRTVWDDLAPSSPFHSWQWNLAWADSYIKSPQYYIVVAETSAGEVRGIVPLRREISRRDGRTLRWLGTGDARPNRCGILVARKHQESVIEAVAEWLAGAARDRTLGWDSMLLENVVCEDRQLGALATTLETLGIMMQSTIQQAGYYRCSLPASWGVVTANLGDRVSEVTPFVAKSATEFAAGIVNVMALHQQQSHHEGTAGRFVGGQFTRFVLRLAPELFARGECSLQQLQLAGRTIAASLILHNEQSAFSYVTGIDPMLAHPGLSSLLRHETLKSLSETGVRNLETYVDDRSHESLLTGETVMTKTVRLVAPTTNNTLFHSVASSHRPAMRIGPKPLSTSLLP